MYPFDILAVLILGSPRASPFGPHHHLCLCVSPAAGPASCQLPTALRQPPNSLACSASAGAAVSGCTVYWASRPAVLLLLLLSRLGTLDCSKTKAKNFFNFEPSPFGSRHQHAHTGLTRSRRFPKRATQSNAPHRLTQPQRGTSQRLRAPRSLSHQTDRHRHSCSVTRAPSSETLIFSPSIFNSLHRFLLCKFF